MRERLLAAERAARTAGEYLLSKSDLTVEHKLANDYVTDADRHSEDIIRSILLEAYPQDGFYGEEESERTGQGGRWIVDPIDGTTNFIKGLPLYTISIAYERDGELLLGCVYCPPLGEMYTAIAGEGAFRNGKPIRVSGQTVLRDAVVGMSFAHRDEKDGARMLALLPLLRARVSDMRRLGSAALDLCLTACGRYEAFIELGLHIWDIAAGIVILREAGGIVTGWPGDAGPLEITGNVLACNKELYGEMFAMLEKPDAIIVLGHRLNPDNTPSDDLKRRIAKTLEYWRETNCPIVMPCGGITRDRTRSEAEVMREMLIEGGMPESVIHLENQSRTTGENIRNAIALLGKDARVALISADYHMESALFDCKQYGLNAYGVPAITPEGPYREKVYAEAAMMMTMRRLEEKEAEEAGISFEEAEKQHFAQMHAMREEAQREGLTREQMMARSMARLRERLEHFGMDTSILEKLAVLRGE